MKKPKIKPGSIGFVMHSDNKLSKVISWFMGSKWSHTFYVWGKCYDRFILAETTDFEVTKTLLNKYNKKTCQFEIWEPIVDHDPKKMALDGQYLEGEIYGYMQLISLGVRRMFMRLKILIKNFFRQGAVCCAVAIAHSNKQEKITCLYGKDPESVDTEELYQIIKNSGQYRMVLKKDFNETWKD